MNWIALCGSMSLSLEKFERLVECFRRVSDIGCLLEQAAGDNLFWLLLMLITIVITNTDSLGLWCPIIHLRYLI